MDKIPWSWCWQNSLIWQISHVSKKCKNEGLISGTFLQLQGVRFYQNWIYSSLFKVRTAFVCQREVISFLPSRLCLKKHLDDGDLKFYLRNKRTEIWFIVLYQKILILLLLLMKSVAKPQLTCLEVQKLRKSGLKGNFVFLYITSFVFVFHNDSLKMNGNIHTDLKGNWFRSSNIWDCFQSSFKCFLQISNIFHNEPKRFLSRKPLNCLYFRLLLTKNVYSVFVTKLVMRSLSVSNPIAQL